MLTPETFRAYAHSPMVFFVDAFKARGLTMADFQRERFELLAPALLSLAVGEKPPIGRYWLEAVKGSSKDSDIALALLWLVCFAHQPIDGQVGAADADQSDEMRKAAKEWLHSLPWLAVPVRIQNGKLICESTGSVVTFVAADASGGAHGSRCLLYVINEISHISKTEFWQTLLDNAAKVNGLVICAGNAGFTDSEAFTLREIYRTTPGHVFHQFCGPVPWQDPAEVAVAKRRNPLARYARLFEGVWTTGSGDALRPEDISAAFTGLPMAQSAIADFEVVGGLDGAVSQHFASFVALGKNAAGRYRVLRCWLWKPPAGGKIDLDSVERTIAQAWRDFRMTYIAADPAKVEHMIQRLQRQQVRIEERNQSGRNLVEQALSLIDNFTSRNIDCPDFPQLEYDLRHLRVEERSYGMRLVSSDDGAFGHGDTCSALSIALAACRDLSVMPTITRLDFDPRYIGLSSSRPSALGW